MTYDDYSKFESEIEQTNFLTGNVSEGNTKINPQCKTVSHYCTVDVLRKIIENQKLRFTDIRFLNDSTEFIDIIEVIRSVVNKYDYSEDFKKLLLADSFIKELEDYKQTQFTCEDTDKSMNISRKTYLIYTCSLSKRPNALSLWNFYATNSSGINIAFDSKTIFALDEPSIKNKMFFNEVLYTKNKKELCIKNLCDSIYDFYCRNKTENNIFVDMICLRAFSEKVNEMRCFFKNSSFSDEKEYRFVLKITSDELKSLKKKSSDSSGFFTRENVLVPYIDCPIKLSSIKKITLNPYVTKESLMELGIKEFLNANKLDNIPIEYSKIPIR